MLCGLPRPENKRIHSYVEREEGGRRVASRSDNKFIVTNSSLSSSAAVLAEVEYKSKLYYSFRYIQITQECAAAASAR